MSILTLEQWQQICQNTPKDDSSATWEANPDPQVLVPQFDKSARSGRGDQAQDNLLSNVKSECTFILCFMEKCSAFSLFFDLQILVRKGDFT